MPGSTPPTSQLDWLISMTAMIVLFWVEGDEGPAQVVRLGHRGTPSLDAATKLPFPRRPPIASLGSARDRPRLRGFVVHLSAQVLAVRRGHPFREGNLDRDRCRQGFAGRRSAVRAVPRPPTHSAPPFRRPSSRWPIRRSSDAARMERAGAGSSRKNRRERRLPPGHSGIALTPTRARL